MTLFRYSGSPRVYPQLCAAGGVAPYTVDDGALVDFGDCPPPDDGAWKASTAKNGAQPPDNHAELAPEPASEDSPPASPTDPAPAPAGDPQE